MYVLLSEPRRCCIDERITLTFSHIDIESSSRCQHDYVKIYDGVDAVGTPRRTLCGSVIPLPYTSFGSALTVQFVSDASIERTGFQASYSESASGLLCSAEIFPTFLSAGVHVLRHDVAVTLVHGCPQDFFSRGGGQTRRVDKIIMGSGERSTSIPPLHSLPPSPLCPALSIMLFLLRCEAAPLNPGGVCEAPQRGPGPSPVATAI